jgi:hypothetical protein
MIITRRLTQEKPIIFDSSEERIVNINTITLESADDKYSIDIFCENKRKKEVLKICSLKKDYQEIYSTNLMLDLHNFKDKYEFFLKTKCKKVLVNIIGCYEQEEDDESEQLPEQKVVKDKKENKGKKELKEKKEIKKELKEKKEIKKEKSDSESESSDEKEIDDNRPSVSLVELLNKKRKEEPQEIKPLILNNLVKNKENKDNKNKEIKKDKKEKKDKITVENIDNKINKKDFKNKKEIKAK